ncbi:MAG: biotin--[acetyl-CoA-carboxylase] ligase [Alphaproteobacteria bacterium]|nr:biotin--[acetyl-CoA-carboxylase] ligase [Alphaproteobacteria bacterium]
MFLELDEIDSTNEEAKRLLNKSTLEHGSVIWAKKQTAGKGRLGRSWESPIGNLYFSMIIHPDLTRASLPQYSPFVACVLSSVIAWYMDDPEDINYKWPNDVLIRDKKTAGILIESNQDSGELVLIIGVGVNIESSPHKTYFPATSMREQGVIDADAFHVLSRFLSEYDVWWQFWHGKGFKAVINELKAHLYGIDKMMRLQITPNHWVDGIYKGIDDYGCLLLEDDKGKIDKFHAGDVFML